MQIKKLLFIFCSFSVFFTGCTHTLGTTQTHTLNSGEEQSNMDKAYSMTEEQRNLLCKISINEDRVKSGKLLNWQKEVLKQYDYAIDYLSGKYPSYSFHITDCEPQNKLNEAYSRFVFTEGNNNENFYELFLYPEDGQYTAEDNFYGTIIKESYEKKLFELITQAGLPCSRIESQLTTLQGKTFCENMDLDPVINGELEMSQNTTIYIDLNLIGNDSYQDVFDKIHAFMDQKKIYGYFDVIIYDPTQNDTPVFNDGFDEFN